MTGMTDDIQKNLGLISSGERKLVGDLT
jgi:hypothetical protein